MVWTKWYQNEFKYWITACYCPATALNPLSLKHSGWPVIWFWKNILTLEIFNFLNLEAIMQLSDWEKNREHLKIYKLLNKIWTTPDIACWMEHRTCWPDCPVYKQRMSCKMSNRHKMWNKLKCETSITWIDNPLTFISQNNSKISLFHRTSFHCAPCYHYHSTSNLPAQVRHGECDYRWL